METLQKDTRRKQVIILFAVVDGFDQLSGKLTSENLSILINCYFEMMQTLINLYGGAMEKYRGNEIKAFFGLRNYNEKTPINAINAALDLQSKIKKQNTELELPVPLQLKISLQSGNVLVGKIGTENYKSDIVLGEPLATTARICDFAEYGQILTGKQIYESMKEKFDFQILEPVPLKGRKIPLPVFELKGRRKTPISISSNRSKSV